MMRVLDLFSGIGAFSLGLERAGMHTAAFCESDKFCQRVLARHWPEVPCYDDVRTLDAARLAADGIGPIDVIAGGWPCQPHSVAGQRNGSADERDLWPEFIRLVREIRPRWVLGENVPGLRSIESGRFFGGILRDLAGCGYRVEWRSISAADVGAPHRRERMWIVAYPDGEGQCEFLQFNGQPQPRIAASFGNHADRCDPAVADADLDAGNERRAGDAGEGARGGHAGGSDLGAAVADASEQGLQIGRGTAGEWPYAAIARGGRGGAESILGGIADGPAEGMDGPDGPWGPGWEDGVPRVANSVPNRVARLRALGNGLVPQIPELIGRAILAAEGAA